MVTQKASIELTKSQSLHQCLYATNTELMTAGSEHRMTERPFMTLNGVKFSVPVRVALKNLNPNNLLQTSLDALNEQVNERIQMILKFYKTIVIHCCHFIWDAAFVPSLEHRILEYPISEVYYINNIEAIVEKESQDKWSEVLFITLEQG